MNKAELIEKLAFLSNPDNEIGLTMYFILKSDEGLIKRKTDISDEVREELKQQFLDYINQKFTINEDLYFADITVADNRKNAAYYYDLNEIPAGLEVMGELIEDEDPPLFNFNNDNYDHIVGYVFLLGNEAEKIAMYKKQYPVSLIKRDSLMLRKSGTRLVKVHDDIIRMNETIEFIQVENELIVISLKTLERFFGFEEVIRNQAKNNLEFIGDANLLEDIEVLSELATELKYAKKIMRVKADSPVLKLSFAKVKKFIKNHPKLKKRLRFNANNSRISLDTRTSKELFLKLLDDDFLKSELTELLYESDIKDRLTDEEEED